MAEPMLCPSCQKPLRVPADFYLAWLTCSHCRALVPNPAAQSDPQPEVTRRARELRDLSRIPSPPAGEAPRTPRVCQSCGKPAEAEWLFCPHCEEPLRAPGVGRIANRDGRNPDRASNPVWAVLGSFGLLFTLLATTGAFAQGSPQPFLIFLACLIILAGISTLVTLVRTDGALTPRNIGRIFLGALSITGMLIAAGGLVALAVMVFAFVVCLAGGRNC
jgi:Double zinc ribbon